MKPIPQTVQDEDLNLLKRTIRTILTEEHPEPLATSNERIYTACRIVVCVSGRGQGLFDTLRIELEQYVARLARSLSSQKEQDPSKWIMHVVRDSSYFTSRIVRFPISNITYVLFHQCFNSVVNYVPLNVPRSILHPQKSKVA